MIKKVIVPFPNKFAYLIGPLTPLFILLSKKACAHIVETGAGDE